MSMAYGDLTERSYLGAIQCSTKDWLLSASWSDTRVYSAYAAIASVLLLLIHLTALISRDGPSESQQKPGNAPNPRSLSSPLVRLFLVILLVGISVQAPRHCSSPSPILLPDYFTSLTLVYVALLALFSLSSAYRITTVVHYHIQVLLLIILAVYTYRDIVPLFTYTSSPQDSCEGWLLWVKVSFLVLASIAVPLLASRECFTPDPNPEQKASFALLITYSFLDNVIHLASRSLQLEVAKLPPLADYDDAKTLKAETFPYLDVFSGANKTRHIFFGLMVIYRWEFLTLAAMSIIEIAAGFAGPIGINRLLNYIENDRQDVVMRPWFWILLLFVGSVSRSLASQWYEFIATRTVVRTEAMITQLIFEHSLRIRPTDSMPDDSKTSSTMSQETSPSRPEDSSSHSTNIIGRINNLVTTDLANAVVARDFLRLIVKMPIEIVLCVVFLYIILGWSAFVGLAMILLCFPIPGWIGNQVHGVQTELMNKTDSRVNSIVEALNLLRMIKLFGWERKMSEKIDQKREEELGWLWKRELMDLSINCVNFVIPIFTLLATYFTYTVIMKEELTASKVFSTITVIDMFREQLYTILASITSTVSGKVSLDRINDFLHKSELLDIYSNDAIQSLHAPQDVIGIKQATFSWSTRPASVQNDFSLTVNDELVFHQGGINLIIGPTGSGKTSLLMALLGEMNFIPSSSQSWFSLPRTGGVAYAAQESWIQNDTIKNNILFGSPDDVSRYRKVIYQCGLEHDLNLFEAGDSTEVGPKGVTLSGGQKARITLARAVYSSAEILLLDDQLASLDVHTAKWIVDKCLRGDLIRGRTVLLVTHNVALAGPIADFVVSVGSDGRVVGRKSVKEAIVQDKALQLEAKKDEEMLARANEDIDAESRLPGTAKSNDSETGKLVIAEEKESGHVSWSAIFMYFNALAGNHRIFFNGCFVVTMMISNLAINTQTYYLGYWASQYEDRPASQVPVFFNLGILAVILFCAVFFHVICRIIFFKGSLRASRSLHHHLLESVFGTTLRWLDTTPLSRVLTRATTDISTIDGPLHKVLFGLWNTISFTFIRFFAIIIISPIFFIPAGVLIIIGCWISQIYMTAQLGIKREMENRRALVLAHFGAAISGLVSIRAYSASTSFTNSSLDLINDYTRSARPFHGLTCWVTVRLDLLSALFSTALAVYLVYFPNSSYLNLDASLTGFSLNMGIGFSMLTLWLVQSVNDFEVQSSSVERIRHYTRIEQEPAPIASGKPPAYWPASGTLRVEHLSAKYSENGKEVLHDLTFEVKGGERIGVVGRTGSGKSSLSLSLLRAIITSGEVYYDGIKTSSINLDALRANITIVPQIPELLSGTVRYNLDPFNQHDDATLNDALKASGLHALQDQEDVGENETNVSVSAATTITTAEARVTLDTHISSGGTNLSVGQRQFLALARAIVRGSKLLILDEATSAIDYKTDAIIQRYLRTELGDDVTLIAIAHRLQTIMDADKIMVLEDGHIVEFDSPRNLMSDKNSKLRMLVDESEDRDELLAMI
ncbi:hypothetical protein D9758_000106 [Tetrapyrgos nigripes]|uniref:P-loop containing nucleoside triphosphate hydrolase protein n=1 Tax=Tetrapyrgos nigripes TaxID=182062 RepID=A0A8H5H272_9AGAR|nr:hypothetical protein D9758_000106 [Tetrapyrgos nigripes]